MVLSKYKKQTDADRMFEFRDDSDKSERMKFHLAALKKFQGLNDNEFLEKSRDMLNIVRGGKEYDPYKRDINYSEFTNEKYQKNKVNIVDNKSIRDQKIDPYNLQKKIQDYIYGLDKNAQEQKHLKDFVQEAVKNFTMHGHTLEEAEKMVKDELFNFGLIDEQDNQAHQDTSINFGEEDDDPREGFLIYARLSTQARNEIYRLFKSGWTIRDLSVRFGIVPERVKFIVWANEYFYNELVPNVDLTTVRLLLEFENEQAEQQPQVEYGLDLQELFERQHGRRMTVYRSCELDAGANDHLVKEEMKERLRTQTKKKYDQVTEDFIGVGQRGYYVNSWYVYKGHGSERLTKKFKSILHHHGKNPGMIPDKVRAKLRKGPRVASKGFGHV